MEFKVGDKVRLKRVDCNCKRKYLGDIVEIKSILDTCNGFAYGVIFREGYGWYCDESDIELVKSWKDYQDEKEERYNLLIKLNQKLQFTSSFLEFELLYNSFKIGDKIEFKNGTKYVIETIEKFLVGSKIMYSFNLKNEELHIERIICMFENDIPNCFNRIGDYDFTIDDKSIKLQRKLDELQNMIDELRKEL